MGQRGQSKTRGFFFFCGRREENYQLGTGIYVHCRIVSAVKRVGVFCDRLSYGFERSLVKYHFF